MKVWILFIVVTVVIQVSAAKINTGLMMVLKTLILLLVPRSDVLQTFVSCWKAALALPMRALTCTSASVSPVLSKMLPR